MRAPSIASMKLSTGMPILLVSLTHRASSRSMRQNIPDFGLTVFLIFLVPLADRCTSSLSNIADKDYRTKVSLRNFFLAHRVVADIFFNSLNLSIFFNFSASVNLHVICTIVVEGTLQDTAFGICEEVFFTTSAPPTGDDSRRGALAGFFVRTCGLPAVSKTAS